MLGSYLWIYEMELWRIILCRFWNWEIEESPSFSQDGKICWCRADNHVSVIMVTDKSECTVIWLIFSFVLRHAIHRSHKQVTTEQCVQWECLVIFSSVHSLSLSEWRMYRIHSFITDSKNSRISFAGWISNFKFAGSHVHLWTHDPPYYSLSHRFLLKVKSSLLGPSSRSSPQCNYLISGRTSLWRVLSSHLRCRKSGFTRRLRTHFEKHVWWLNFQRPHSLVCHGTRYHQGSRPDSVHEWYERSAAYDKVCAFDTWMRTAISGSYLTVLWIPERNVHVTLRSFHHQNTKSRCTKFVEGHVEDSCSRPWIRVHCVPVAFVVSTHNG